MSKQNQNLVTCQKEAEEVKILMKKNVDKVYEREGKLSDLEERSNELLNKSSNFQKTARTVERQTRWEKWRWYVIGGAIVALVLIIFIAIIATQLGGGESPAEKKTESDGSN